MRRGGAVRGAHGSGLSDYVYVCVCLVRSLVFLSVRVCARVRVVGAEALECVLLQEHVLLCVTR